MIMTGGQAHHHAIFGGLPGCDGNCCCWIIGLAIGLIQRFFDADLLYNGIINGDQW